LPFGDYWKHVDTQLQRCEISAAQVQLIWLKTALAHKPRGFPEEAQLLQRALRSIVGILSTKFPQLKLVYVSSRIYVGELGNGLESGTHRVRIRIRGQVVNRGAHQQSEFRQVATLDFMGSLLVGRWLGAAQRRPYLGTQRFWAGRCPPFRARCVEGGDNLTRV